MDATSLVRRALTAISARTPRISARIRAYRRERKNLTAAENPVIKPFQEVENSRLGQMVRKGSAVRIRFRALWPSSRMWVAWDSFRSCSVFGYVQGGRRSLGLVRAGGVVLRHLVIGWTIDVIVVVSERGHEIRDVVVMEAIEGMPAVASDFDEPGLSEQTKLVRCGALSETGLVGQPVNCFLTVKDRPEQLQAAAAGEESHRVG